MAKKRIVRHCCEMTGVANEQFCIAQQSNGKARRGMALICKGMALQRSAWNGKGMARE